MDSTNTFDMGGAQTNNHPIISIEPYPAEHHIKHDIVTLIENALVFSKATL